jgi:hypothetical protein
MRRGLAGAPNSMSGRREAVLFGLGCLQMPERAQRPLSSAWERERWRGDTYVMTRRERLMSIGSWTAMVTTRSNEVTVGDVIVAFCCPESNYSTSSKDGCNPYSGFVDETGMRSE